MRSDWIFKTMTDAFPPRPTHDGIVWVYSLSCFVLFYFTERLTETSVFCPCTYRTLMDLEGPVYSEVWLLSAAACRGIWRWDADYPRAVQAGAPAACTHSTKSRVINNWVFVGGKAWKLSWLGSHQHVMFCFPVSTVHIYLGPHTRTFCSFLFPSLPPSHFK